MFRQTVRIVFAAALLATRLVAQESDPLVAAYPADKCPSCAEWNLPQRPFRLHGNTYYVGTRGLSSLLITSREGHVLIDGGLPNSAPMILENIRMLGFAVSDVRLIVNSHAHYDHAGGLAALQRATGAHVAASPASAPVIRQGRVGSDDPQHGIALDMPAVSVDEILADGQTVRIGFLSLTAHFTSGHTPGGTTWSWRSCEAERCLQFVYADSQTPVSRDGFRFSNSDAYPTAVADFQRGFAILEQLPCDVLVTPHPGASSLWDRTAAGSDGLVDAEACRNYAASARQQLQRRLQREAESGEEREHME
jgi:metallo-beta-lactamase class B